MAVTTQTDRKRNMAVRGNTRSGELERSWECMGILKV
jgi:hypothetical protein